MVSGEWCIEVVDPPQNLISFPLILSYSLTSKINLWATNPFDYPICQTDSNQTPTIDIQHEPAATPELRNSDGSNFDNLCQKNYTKLPIGRYYLTYIELLYMWKFCIFDWKALTP